MGRHRMPVELDASGRDYFEQRAAEMQAEQEERYRTDPPKQDDLTRHLRELQVSDLIQQFRTISATYKEN